MSLFIERTGPRQYQGHNERGASIEIGKGEGQWSPGELMKIALAGCNAMSSDQRLMSLLGEDFALSAGVEADYSESENRYLNFTIELVPDFGEATEEEIAQVKERALRAIDRQCTVGRTLDHVVPHSVSITVEQ